MAPVVSEQAAGASVPEAHDAIQAASINHGGARLPQQLHDARLHQGARDRAASGPGKRRGTCATLREGGEEWGVGRATESRARAPGCLYLVLTLVPEGLRRQVIDGQGPIQVANSCQGHPGWRRAPLRLVEGPGLTHPALLPGSPAQAPLTKPSSPQLSSSPGRGPSHTHTLQKPKDSTELDSLSSPSPTLGWEATVSGLKTPTTYKPWERIRGWREA